MKKLCVLFAAVLFAAAAFHEAPTHVSAKSDKFHRSSRPIPNRYIVVLDPNQDFRSDPDGTIADLNKNYPGEIDHVFSSALNGYSVQMPPGLAMQLSADPRVKYVEEDSLVDLQSTETGATWGISRIDQRSFIAPLDTNYYYNASGAGVSVYVIDTGVLTTHPDFGGRAVDAFDAYHDGGDMTVCNGHGTHVAGTIGSNTYGVAKSAMIYSVKVYPCDTAITGSMSAILSGIDWVNRHAVHPAVANMSMSGAASQTLDDAVRSSIATGITYVVSAGNNNDNACNYSPARTAEAITVGATDERDYRSSISNYGRCVDIFAPGEYITSLSNKPDSPTFIMSGTSTSSPHIAGIAALYLEQHPTAAPTEVQSTIVGNATPGVVTDVGTNSPNLFAYSLFPASTTGCGGTDYNGSLSSSGAADYQSSSNGFNGGSGRYQANLSIPAGSSFSLSLEKKGGGNRWSAVASSTTGSILYKGKSGTYRWKVMDVAGSGTYSLCAMTP